MRRHVRTEAPPPVTVYQKLKPYLRREFRRRCVYCLDSDFRGRDRFAVEHYVPRHAAPERALDYTNSFYACATCNSRKGGWQPPANPSRKTQVIVNPCDYAMGRHLRFDGPQINAVSAKGEYTRDHLDLDDEARIRHRERLLDTVRAMRTELGKQRALLAKLDDNDALVSLSAAVEIDEARDYAARLERWISEIEDAELPASGDGL